MADYTVEIFPGDHKRGDEWPGMSVGPVLIGDPPAQPADALLRVRAHYILSVQGDIIYRFDSDVGESPDAPIVIDNATTWEVTFTEVLDGWLPLAGNWRFDIEFFRTGSAAPRTIYKGVQVVHDDVTK